MSRDRHHELHWHAEKSYAARDIQRIQHNTRIACERTAAILAGRRAARPQQKAGATRLAILVTALVLVTILAVAQAHAMGAAFGALA